jgi:predicted ATPase
MELGGIAVALPVVAAILGVASGSVTVVVSCVRAYRHIQQRRRQAARDSGTAPHSAHAGKNPPSPPDLELRHVTSLPVAEPGSNSPTEVKSVLAIRTPDQRLRVFVSSTLGELAEERVAARQAITRLRLAPVLFELGARPHPPRSLYRAYLAQSEIFIGIYWQKYGWVAPGEEVSGLEDEYRLSGLKPKLIYLKIPSTDREPQLAALLDRIRGDDHVSYKSFSTPSQLRNLIVNDLALLLTERFALADSDGRATPVATAGPHTAALGDLSNLPVPFTRLIGRDTELLDVRQALGAHRVVTLTGPGGTGKTRLALQVADEVRNNFADGVFVVALAPLSDPGLVVGTIARVLGIRDLGARPVLDILKESLRARRLLLVVDNFEQVLEAAPALTELLAACPGLKALVTSREPLRVRAEQEVAVRPLALPDPRHAVPVMEMARNPAVALFVERAAAIKPDFRLSQDNATAVAEICVRLDGLPLAIELASARMRLLSPQALLARLDQRLALLTGGGRDLPARQQTMRAALTWSYDLLEAGEQTLFCRLAVFVGDATLEAIETTCNETRDLRLDVLDGVESLISKSLLQQIEVPHGEPRFGMLGTIREYAQEKLDASGEADTLRQRHTDYYLALAEAAKPHLRGPQQARWLERLELEHDNLRAALRWCVEQGEVERGLRLGGALSRFWEVRGHLSEGRARLTDVLGLGAGMGPGPRTAARATALNGAGSLAWRQGDYGAARSQLEESLMIRRKLGDRQGIASTLNNLGNVATHQGDYAVARSQHEESVAISREVGDRRGIASSLINLGRVAHHQGDYTAARSLQEESLAIFREVGDRRGIAMSLINLGEVADDQGDQTPARSMLDESLAIFRELGDRHGIAISLINLGRVAHHQGDYAEARSLDEESLAIFREVGDRWGVASSLNNLGFVAKDQGDSTAAQRLLEEGITVARELGNPVLIAHALDGFAGVAATQGQGGRALRLAGVAARLRESIGAPLSPAEQESLQRKLHLARQLLSDDAGAAAWAEGQAMSEEQALAYALEPAEPGSSASAAAGEREPGSLTPRQ